MKKMINIIILSLTIMMLCSCTSQKDAERALTGAGFTNIQTGGYSFFECGSHDWYHTKFTATNPLGEETKGVVCSGLFFKGSTIRF